MFKRSTSPDPAALLEQTRAAQEQHAAEVGAANQRLVDSHTAIYSAAKSRQETIAEQVKLLNAEHDGLTKVAETANPANL